MSYLQVCIIGAIASFLSFLVVYLAGRLAALSIERSPEMRDLEKMLPRRSRLESRLELRAADVKAEITQLTVEEGNLRRQFYILEKDMQEARREADAPVRVLGREGQTPTYFRAWLVNRQVQAALADGKEHPSLDSEWADPQVVEVWADSLANARTQLQSYYPPPLGFTVLNMKLQIADSLREAS